jgi:hypothetical protein
MADEDKKLTDDNPDAKLAETDAAAGAGVAPEDTQGGNDYDKVIAKQQETINTLLGQIDNLNNQIVNYIRSNGSKVSDEENPDNPAKQELPEDYTYLKDLGKEIGKRD